MLAYTSIFAYTTEEPIYTRDCVQLLERANINFIS